VSAPARPTVRLARQQIREHFAWDDPSIRCWSLHRPFAGPLESRLVEAAALPILAGVLPLLVPLVPLWLLSRLAPRAAFWVAVALLGLTTLLYLLAAVMSLLPRTNTQWRDMAANRPLFPALALGFLLAVIAVPGSPVGAGFDFGDASPAAGLWARYVGEHAGSILLLDVPRSVVGRFTPLQPESGLAIAAVILLRVLFSLGVVEVVALSWRRHVRRRVFHATVRGAWVACVDPFGQKGVLRHLGVLEELVQPETMLAAELVVKLDDRLRAEDGCAGETSAGRATENR